MSHARFYRMPTKHLIGVLNIDLIFGKKKLGSNDGPTPATTSCCPATRPHTSDDVMLPRSSAAASSPCTSEPGRPQYTAAPDLTHASADESGMPARQCRPRRWWCCSLSFVGPRRWMVLVDGQGGDRSLDVGTR